MKRWVSGSVIALLMLVGVMPAATAAGGFDLTLDRLEPQWLAQPSAVTLSMTIRASSASTEPVNLSVRQSERPLAGRADIASVMSGGSKIPSVTIKQASTGIPLSEGVNIFDLTLSPNELRLTDNGVYLLHVTARAGTTKSSFDVLLPYFNEANIDSFEPLKVLPLWTVAARPSLNVRNQYLNHEWVNTFSDTGSVGAIVKAAAGRSDLTWLIDPDTVWTAERIAGGGEVLGRAIEVITDEQSSAAANWLESLKFATGESDVYSLPYANAEVNALINNGLVELATAAVTHTQALTDTLQRPQVARAAIAHRGDFSYNTWKWLNEQGLYMTILSDAKYASTAASFTSNGVAVFANGRKSLVVDTQATRQFSGALAANTRGPLRRQALISDLLITMLERPNDPRVLVLRPDTTATNITYNTVADTLDSLSVPWISSVTVTDALKDVTTSDRKNARVRIGAAIRKTALKDIKWVQRRRASLEGLIGGTAVDAAIQDAQIRLASATYRGTEVRAMRLATINDLRNVIGSVEIMSSGAVMFPREEAVVPITIRNDLPVEVTVRVIAIGEPSVRVSPSDVGLITIQPGKRKSIEIPTTLVGSDLAFLNLRLADKDGQVFGARTRIQLSSSAYAQAASYVIGGAALLLVVMIVVNAVRRVRSRKSTTPTTISADE